LQDNNGLYEAISNGKTIPVFIFTPEQIGQINKYRSQNSINFMCESLKELDSDLKKYGSKLHTYFGNTTKVIAKLIGQIKPTGIYCNANYTPYAKKRDNEIAKLCDAKNIEFCQFEDYGLLPIGSVKSANGTYKKFTPYYNAAKNKKVAKPKKYNIHNLAKISGGNYPITKFYKKHNLPMFGGRKNSLKIISNMSKFGKYGTTRNILAINTTELSAFLKFGCISAREVYHSISNKSGDLVKQLFWRDFFMNLVDGYPHILNGPRFKRNFKQKYNTVKWQTNQSLQFKKWCQGQTGYPIVDAAMTQLNTIGWMHNRGRLIVAWFLTKILGIHWELGEQYFATKLRDYDPAQNNGGWQFCAGSGVDTDQYFRQFNPWAHSEKYDPNGEYIKKWLPILKDVKPKDLHKWDQSWQNYNIKYPKPIVNYEDAKNKVRKIYK